MTPLAESSTYILSIGVVLLQVFSFVILMLLLFRAKAPSLEKNALIGVFIITLGSILGSLFYSQIVGFIPCEFCWYLRILIYPQALILLIAFIKKDKRYAVEYVLWMSVIGALVAAYQYYGQMFASAILPCSTSVLAASCQYKPFIEFGYITIPMMAFAALFANILLCLFYKRGIKNTV